MLVIVYKKCDNYSRHELNNKWKFYFIKYALNLTNLQIRIKFNDKDVMKFFAFFSVIFYSRNKLNSYKLHLAFILWVIR